MGLRVARLGTTKEYKMNLNDLTNHVALKMFGMTVTEAHAKHICVDCKSPIRDERGEDAEATGENGQIYSDAGWKEYRISGLCETCFDSVGGN